MRNESKNIAICQRHLMSKIVLIESIDHFLLPLFYLHPSPIHFVLDYTAFASHLAWGARLHHAHFFSFFIVLIRLHHQQVRHLRLRRVVEAGRQGSEPVKCAWHVHIVVRGLLIDGQSALHLSLLMRQAMLHGMPEGWRWWWGRVVCRVEQHGLLVEGREVVA